MRATLSPHPDFPAPAIAIEGEAERIVDRNRLSLSFRLSGDVESVRIPPYEPPGRADELWRHTCFEAFVAPAAGDGYYEINLSPSCKWATYRFDGYRLGMTPAAATAMSSRALRPTPDEFVLYAEIPFRDAPELAGAWRVGLTAIVEAADGALSYWSVAHPPGRPDFHHRDCLALELPAPEAP